MASPAPPVSNGSSIGTAKPSGTSRTGWGPNSPEQGFALRGAARARGRGGRGGHNGGRLTNGRSGPAPVSEAGKKSPQDPKPKLPSVSPKVPTSAPSVSQRPVSLQPPASSRPSRPRSLRKALESKASRGPSLSVDPVVPPASNTSPSVSPRIPSRRKRSHTNNKDMSQNSPSSASANLPRKPSLTTELTSNSTRASNSKPVSAPAPVKDMPPHLAPRPAAAPTFDIRHDIDALVERVRAGAMDRPHTPGSHIDWADDDDSLPDLDDWGITSNITTDSGKGSSVISPILQDALKPLPSIVDIDVPTPSIKVYEVNRTQKGLQGGQGSGGMSSSTPRTEGVPQASTTSVDAETLSEISAHGQKAQDSAPSPALAPSHDEKAETKSATTAVSNPATESTTKPITSPKIVHPSAPDFFSNPSSPPPDRGLTASIHASASTSPNHLSPPPAHPRGGFQPSHSRAHTLGRFRQEYMSDSERPRKNDSLHGHGRNHSTPPAGAAATHGHARASSRPVITGDAISKLARTLGGTALAKRDPTANTTAAAPTASKAL